MLLRLAPLPPPLVPNADQCYEFQRFSANKVGQGLT